jgi:hypothetical protein
MADSVTDQNVLCTVNLTSIAQMTERQARDLGGSNPGPGSNFSPEG